MKEFNDLLTQITRIADSLDKIANAHGMALAPAPAVSTATAPEQQTEAPKKRGPKGKTAESAPAPEVAPAAPVEVPETEDLFGGETDAPVEYTIEDVKEMLTLALKNVPQEEVSALFKQHNGGVPKVSAMDPKYYGAVVEAFKAMLTNLPG